MEASVFWSHNLCSRTARRSGCEKATLVTLPHSARLGAIIGLLGLLGAGPCSAGEILSHAPKQAKADERYLFYLHGRILEEQGRKAVSPDYGPYEYDAILAALAERGFTVISELRPPDGGLDYARKVAAEVRGLIAAGVTPQRITVSGFSKGGVLALATAAALGDTRVNFVVMGGCGSDAAETLGPRLRGRILSVYEASDEIGVSCESVFKKATGLKQREAQINLGLRHGSFYKPRKEWIDPLVEWARGER